MNPVGTEQMAVSHLKILLDDYFFPKQTLCNYLGLTASQLERLVAEDRNVLPIDPEQRVALLNKIEFLYLTATENKDSKLVGFLDILMYYHGFTNESIAKMAGVEIREVNDLLYNSSTTVSDEVKYKLAVTAMSLRFFLKETETK